MKSLISLPVTSIIFEEELVERIIASFELNMYAQGNVPKKVENRLYSAKEIYFYSNVKVLPSWSLLNSKSCLKFSSLVRSILEGSQKPRFLNVSRQTRENGDSKDYEHRRYYLVSPQSTTGNISDAKTVAKCYEIITGHNLHQMARDLSDQLSKTYWE